MGKGVCDFNVFVTGKKKTAGLPLLFIECDVNETLQFELLSYVWATMTCFSLLGKEVQLLHQECTDLIYYY